MKISSPLRRLSRWFVPAAAILLSAANLTAHDFWLIPNAFLVAPGEPLEVRGHTSSSFPTSLSAVSLERVAAARLIDAGGETALRDLSHAGKSLMIRHRPKEAGQKIVAARLHPTSVRESADGFRNYLVVEGAPEALERYGREGKLPTDSITRRYAKYAKTLVEVGLGGPRAFSKLAGHPLEFVPLTDPAMLKAGETLAVRLLFDGHPLRGIRVHASGVPATPGMDAETAAAGAHEIDALTDAEGVVRLPVARAGLWNVRTLHILPAAPGSGADWDTHWASLVFSVGGDAAGSTADDSAAVVATIERFHAALSAGDTIAARELLTDDATILESGGVETKAEYLSHHLPGDIAFARAVPRERGEIDVHLRGDVAWASSTSSVQGRFRDRDIDSMSAELMVLERGPEGWRIAAIHWSSRARQR